MKRWMDEMGITKIKIIFVSGYRTKVAHLAFLGQDKTCKGDDDDGNRNSDNSEVGAWLLVLFQAKLYSELWTKN